MPDTICCFYSCAECSLLRQFVEVPERDPDTQDIMVWLNTIAVPALVADHKSKSPLCRPKAFSEIGIPVDDGTDHIGANTRS